MNSSAAASGGGAQPGEANSGPQLASAPTASATAAAAAAAIGTLPQVHNLLDFVAWLTSRECGSREQRPLSEELAAVEQAAARMQVLPTRTVTVNALWPRFAHIKGELQA